MKRPTSINPPRFVQRILSALVDPTQPHDLLDDLQESYAAIAESEGRLKANLWYFMQVLKILRGRVFNALYWNLPMLGNTLKTSTKL